MAVDRSWSMLVAASLAAWTASGAARSYEVVEQPIRVPIVDLAGHHRFMSGSICRPEGVEKPRLAVINHGSSTRAADRPYIPVASCNNEAVRWFMDRRYAVVQVWRLGYGATGGAWTEGFDKCTARDYYKAGLETARQISAIVDYSISLPGVDPNDVVVVGHSGGGWGAIAYDGSANSHVSAVVNMAGGRGGHYRNKADSNCGADQLVDAVRLFAKTGSTPMLWIYADNDSYFGPQLANRMAATYESAGGKLRFYKTAAYGEDGHSLFFESGGSKIWGPLVQAYLAGARHAIALPGK
jgi:dienelactone hydrolase